MPRRRRVAKGRDGGRLTPGTPPYMNDKWEDLMSGFDFSGGYGVGAHRDDAARHEAWEANREALAVACRERYGPGCRPQGWWDYEAPVTIRTSFTRADTWRPNQRGPSLPPAYVTLMRQFGLLTPEERTALGV